MSTRGFTLYQLNALSRLQHMQGHSGIDCTVTDDIDTALGDRHSEHAEFYAWHAEYLDLVAMPVRESPVCPVCGNVHPVYVGIPGRVLSGVWVPGGAMVECGHCGHRIAYNPHSY